MTTHDHSDTAKTCTCSTPCNAKSVKYILVPVDFSEESRHAVRYAEMLAGTFGLGITLAHVHEPTIDPMTSTSLDQMMMKKNQARLEKMMIGLGWDQLRCNTRFPYDIHFDTGNPESGIQHLAESDKYACIVMSTRTENIVLKKLLGSVAWELSKTVSKPIFVIPHIASLVIPTNWVVGIAEEKLNPDTIQELLAFGASNSAFIRFVAVTNDPDKSQSALHKMFERLELHPDHTQSFEVHTLLGQHQKTEKLLMGFAEEHHADLLVLITHQRSFLESLSHRSTSRQTLLQPTLPVLLLHEENNALVGLSQLTSTFLSKKAHQN